jgi:hypothetical protein
MSGFYVARRVSFEKFDPIWRQNGPPEIPIIARSFVALPELARSTKLQGTETDPLY